MEIFKQTRAWCQPGDLSEQQLELFRPASGDKRTVPSVMTAPSEEVKYIDTVYHKAMIAAIRNEMNRFSQYITLPYVIFLTDRRGRILERVCSSPELQEEMNRAEFRIGVSLCRQQSGLNAVSLAMEMNCIGVVRGTEHSEAGFGEWNCICAPLKAEGQVYGYVDISFNRREQIEFAIPFIQQIAENITGRWMESHPEMQQFRLENSFQEYKLTAREQDVARLWLLEKSALHISSELGISEGTVRNMLKSIYSKMKVNDRWQFAKRLVH